MSEPHRARPGAALIEYEDLFRHAPYGYLCMAADGRIEKANDTLARWIERPADSLVGQRFRDLLTMPGRIFYETNFAPMLRLEGGLEEVALELLTASGEVLPVFVNAKAQPGEQGEVSGVRVALVRARSRRGYERDLRAREAVAVQRLSDERLTAELREQFIAVLGHDLRNPLASIQAGAALLARQELDARGTMVLAMMHASMARMAGLIDNVLDFARGRLGGGLSLVRAPCAARPAIEQVIAELQASHPTRLIETDLRFAGEIDCDVARLSQLLSNLVGNALTHGALDKPVQVSAGTEGDQFVLRVANGGDPIPAAALPKLFLPFKRGVIRPNQQGLGLGLYIASEIAQAHGGQIDVESDALETAFTFRMPLL